MRVVLSSAVAMAGLAAASEKSRPVSKVIKLLKDMQAQLEAEGEEVP